MAEKSFNSKKSKKTETTISRPYNVKHIALTGDLTPAEGEDQPQSLPTQCPKNANLGDKV